MEHAGNVEHILQFKNVMNKYKMCYQNGFLALWHKFLLTKYVVHNKL